MTDYESNPLYRIMHPRSVAVWGASNNPMGMGSILLSQLLALGFEGPVYPIHPKETEVLGLRAYRSISDVLEVPDLALLVLPTRVVPEVLEQCGRAGIKHAIVVSGGFAEAGEDGKRLQDQIVEIARKYGIRFLGPNCIGVANPYHKLNTTFFPYEASRGFIGMASQSGSFVTQMFMHLAKFDLGFSQALSVGNEAQTNLTDCLQYLAQCPNTRVIALYIEGIRHGREFVRVAREVSKKKPIVAYYIGGSSAGKKAGLSHTAALAGPDELYDGIFKQTGIVRASGIEELFDFCYVIGSLPLPKGDRVAILTHSGGPGAAAADAADRSGLKLADFAPDTLEELRTVVPHTASITNPVDLTFSRNPTDYTDTMPRALLRDPGVDSLFIYLLLSWERVVKSIQALTNDPENTPRLAEEFIKSQASGISALSPAFDKPVVGASFAKRSEPFIQELHARGVPILPSPERAVRALAALSRYAAMRRALLAEEASSPAGTVAA